MTKDGRKNLELEGGEEAEELVHWEHLAVDAVGNFIEFWGFKRNQGRVWGLLYLKGKPFSAAHIQHALSLSKGAVSMITRELEQWGVIHRVRSPSQSSWHFVAENDLMKMISRVLQEREANVVERIRNHLDEAEAMAEADKDVPEEVLERLKKMKKLADMASRSVTLLMKTAQLDLGGFIGVLKDTTTDWLLGRKKK